MGVTKKIFKFMLEILEEAKKEEQKMGRRPNRIGVENKLIMFLTYLRKYIPM